MTIPFKKLLVVADPTTDEQPAFERAISIAKRLHCTIELFICDYDQYIASAWQFDVESQQKARESFLERRRSKLQKLAKRPRAEGLSVNIDVRWDHPLDDGILRKAEESKPDLVIKDTHYHSVIKRAIFSNTDWDLIRACRVPLLLVKPRTLSANPQLLAAVDPTHQLDRPAALDDRILATTIALNVALRGDVHVFHAFDPTPLLAASDALTAPLTAPIRDMIRDLREQHSGAAQELTDRYAIPAGRLHIAQGPTRETLTDLAEELPADVVVMGAVSRSALKRAFIGATAERTLDRLPCDLMVVPTADSAQGHREIDSDAA